MPKSLFIAEKPSVARSFAGVLKENMAREEGYLESKNYIVTWCVGHLVTMSYPDRYDEAYKKWDAAMLPFLPEKFLYEIIPGSARQFAVVSELLNREDVGTVFVCTDSGREGEYIYRLVAQEAGIKGKVEKRVWIDSQTEEEMLRGIKEAKLLSEYDDLAASAYLRAKEDYLMGINFSRILSIKYAGDIKNITGNDYKPVSVGRVMTCVLGMVVRREREIRDFVKKPFYRVLGTFSSPGGSIEGEWRVTEKSAYFGSPYLYKDNGFNSRETAQELIGSLSDNTAALVLSVEKKKETKNPPLLFNLAELQNECSKLFKISPDETLGVAQELYEKRLVTYPRTDARVLSSAIAKEIDKNIRGLQGYSVLAGRAKEVLESGKYKGIANTRYTNDKQITDHYALIPTGQGLGALSKLGHLQSQVYELIVRRFLSIFYPPAVYEKVSITAGVGSESFFASARVLKEEGYLALAYKSDKTSDDKEEGGSDESLSEVLSGLKKGSILNIDGFAIKEGETSPPKRYTSGSMILAMENAGSLIEDEDLRAQIKGSGIGTSATRAEILKKLNTIGYLSTNKKTQVIIPTLTGELVYDTVDSSIRSLLNPELTASWEKGLSYVAEGSVTSEEYMEKLSGFIRRNTENVKNLNNRQLLRRKYDAAVKAYKKQ